MRRFHQRWFALAALLALAGCNKPKPPVVELAPEKDYATPLPPGQLALRKITDPERIPDFSPGYRFTTGLADATDRSLNYMSKPSSRNYFPYGEITHDHAVASLRAFKEVLSQAKSGEELNALIRERFDTYESVGYNGEGIVLFTSYYCPIFDARLAPDAEFRYPLYSAPDDLVKDTEGNCKGRRMPDGSVAAGYPDRRQIVSSNMMAGKEIVWLRDPFEAYIVTVQGSAKLRMADGSYYEIGYIANNGHEYVSIGRKMVDDGKIEADKLSLRTMIEFFRDYPGELEYYTNLNPRYVFFGPRPGGPFGSLNEPVTPYRTIATDKEVYPRACVAFMQTSLPAREEGDIVTRGYHAFALDQDTGGAIRAPGRCDVFLGTGDEPGELAGRTAAEGRLYYIFLKQ